MQGPGCPGSRQHPAPNRGTDRASLISAPRAPAATCPGGLDGSDSPQSIEVRLAPPRPPNLRRSTGSIRARWRRTGAPRSPRWRGRPPRPDPRRCSSVPPLPRTRQGGAASRWGATAAAEQAAELARLLISGSVWCGCLEAGGFDGGFLADDIGGVAVAAHRQAPGLLKGVAEGHPGRRAGRARPRTAGLRGASAASAAPGSQCRPGRRRGPRYLIVFDVLEADGTELLARPYRHRRAVLEERFARGDLLSRFGDRVTWSSGNAGRCSSASPTAGSGQPRRHRHALRANRSTLGPAGPGRRTPHHAPRPPGRDRPAQSRLVPSRHRMGRLFLTLARPTPTPSQPSPHGTDQTTARDAGPSKRRSPHRARCATRAGRGAPGAPAPHRRGRCALLWDDGRGSGDSLLPAQPSVGHIRQVRAPLLPGQWPPARWHAVSARRSGSTVYR
ncbi:hypothetical protein SGLAU_32410 [Streptomyces glaucescens]|uniref:ATP-dependent DNA ligase family profile domain-containing protein n=1 Tax=Streptomyces glaucescens TaxID=1907 RepID=A0A089XGL8_STRGA|nr:hypothetical protein SGLAU_32410 [Streptomyces glaucescens]